MQLPDEYQTSKMTGQARAQELHRVVRLLSHQLCRFTSLISFAQTTDVWNCASIGGAGHVAGVWFGAMARHG